MPLGPPKVRVEKKSEVHRVYQQIKAWVLQGRLRPGEFVSEVELARYCKTSRTPVREAAGRLSQEGWISRLPRRGYLVAPITVRDIMEVYEFRKLLECFAAEKLAALATPEQIADLKAIAAAERKPGVGAAELHAMNDRVHLGIAEAAGNRRVAAELRRTLEYVRRLDTLGAEKDSGAVLHGEIVAALEARRPGQARRAMAAHIDLARDRMLRLFGS